MKKAIYTAVVLAIAVFIGSGAAHAANLSNAAICQEILTGIPFVYEGTVVSMGSGQGIEIATETGNVIVYGIGPVRYWESLGMDRLAVGDAVTAEGYTIDFTGVERNIAMSLIVNDVEIQLRDPDTAKPLWIGYKRNQK